MTVDLNTCRPGQQLLTDKGSVLTYKCKNPPHAFYPHEVIYPNGGGGSRTDDGFVMMNKETRLPTDHNVVKILPYCEFSCVDTFSPAKIHHFRVYKDGHITYNQKIHGNMFYGRWERINRNHGYYDYFLKAKIIFKG